MKRDRIELPMIRPDSIDQPVDPRAYPVIDTDLARDNLENDLPEADRQDL